MSESAPPREAPYPHGVRLFVRYDGTDFHGWQYQESVRTVQGELERAIAKMAGAEFSRVRGASRTDAGVHAAGQVASFDCAREIAPRGWVMGLNGYLPDDVAVSHAEACPPDYQPRFDTFEKTYHYRVYCGRVRDPLRARNAWYVGPGLARKDLRERTDDVNTYLDLEAMQQAARALEGEHDFRAFRAADDERESTIRRMESVTVTRGHEPGDLLIAVRGSAFMKNMVRIMAGTLVEVGRTRMSPAVVGSLLGPDARREDGGPTAPAHGLTLMGMRLGRLAASGLTARGA
ncbi:MAG: tRNA pseudouridine(38-40) synthase TruA [Polyangiales bacterium]|nr:tRNA pseudouridine(38-40) synthase TruA [Myxococcales bacterium]MCB9659115.1 tRNA pseudouridine(38-40) synthase TruA [Sandaracinaceae bacterium]